MRKKILSATIIMALTAMMFAGCTPEAAEAEVTYKVVGGISEPTRVWNEVAEAPAEVPVEETAEEYIPDVLPMDPLTFVTNKAANTLTSDKDGEVVETLDEGTEIVLVGTTGKGYYQTEDGAFISASDVEKVVIEEQVAETETKPATTTTTTTTQTPTTTTETPAPAQEQPTQQESQPAPAPEPTPTPEPTPEPEPQPAYDEEAEIAAELELQAQLTAQRQAEMERQAACPHTNTEFIAEWAHDLATGEWVSATHCLDCGAYF